MLATLAGGGFGIYFLIKFLTDLVAIWWVGMFMGLSQKNSNQAFIMTVLIAFVIPFVIFCLPGVVIDLALINWAKTRLNREFRKLAVDRLGLAEQGSWKRVAVRAAPEAIPPVIAR